MKKRVETLFKNAGIYFGIVLVVFFNIWFWTAHTSSRRREIEGFQNRINSLEREIGVLKQKKSTVDQETRRALAEIERRATELKGYGDFLPDLSTKPDVVKEILGTIEELGIKISKIVNDRIAGGQGGAYVTFSFGLELEGSYRDFKLLLAKIYKSERVIRIKKFHIADWDTKDHTQRVSIEFQTFFAST